MADSSIIKPTVTLPRPTPSEAFKLLRASHAPWLMRAVYKPDPSQFTLYGHLEAPVEVGYTNDYHVHPENTFEAHAASNGTFTVNVPMTVLPLGNYLWAKTKAGWSNPFPIEHPKTEAPWLKELDPQSEQGTYVQPPLRLYLSGRDISIGDGVAFSVDHSAHPDDPALEIGGDTIEQMIWIDVPKLFRGRGHRYAWVWNEQRGWSNPYPLFFLD